MNSACPQGVDVSGGGDGQGVLWLSHASQRLIASLFIVRIFARLGCVLQIDDVGAVLPGFRYAIVGVISIRTSTQSYQAMLGSQHIRGLDEKLADLLIGDGLGGEHLANVTARSCWRRLSIPRRGSPPAGHAREDSRVSPSHRCLMPEARRSRSMTAARSQVATTSASVANRR